MYDPLTSLERRRGLIEGGACMQEGKTRTSPPAGRPGDLLAKGDQLGGGCTACHPQADFHLVACHDRDTLRGFVRQVGLPERAPGCSLTEPCFVALMRARATLAALRFFSTCCC